MDAYFSRKRAKALRVEDIVLRRGSTQPPARPSSPSRPTKPPKKVKVRILAQKRSKSTQGKVLATAITKAPRRRVTFADSVHNSGKIPIDLVATTPAPKLSSTAMKQDLSEPQRQRTTPKGEFLPVLRPIWAKRR